MKLLRLSVFLMAACLFIALGGKPAQALIFQPALLEYEADPGSLILETIRMENDKSTTETYYTVYQDFTVEDETGATQFLEPGELAAVGSLAAWFAPMEPITLEPGEVREVELAIVVPPDAEPGSHFGAALFFDQNPEIVGNAVGVGSKTGPVVLVRVSGDVVEDMELLEFKLDPEDKKWHNRPPVDFVIRTKNNGTVHENPRGMITVSGWWPKSEQVDANPLKLKVLPGSIRRIETTWETGDLLEGGFFAELVNEFRNFAIGPQRATLALAYGTQGKILTSHLEFWVFPWHIILVGLVILLLVIGIFMLYNRAVVNQAMKKIERKRN